MRREGKCCACGRKDSKLLTARDLEEEYGLSRRMAASVMQRCPVLAPTFARRVYVRRSDVEALIESWVVDRPSSVIMSRPKGV